ncbi:glycoside hydrolase family 43 protein [Xylanibacter muris]|uniref:Glycosyl hydrolase 43 family protein n=1 Tax=Xylanibacter muris TaxID=2736290 RepID=A0ABX2APR9_9BACT|nr:glycoside hydrolase 43 family protein [Xylanibacter muris]NPD92968.1 glycosyl hydrolase 43 family protein [Xylanibacter muris]
MIIREIIFTLFTLLLMPVSGMAQSWTADNGNGTYTNPLFYDEFSDPDIIRVGEDFYLAGTTMHCLPGLIVLHSKDLVNWELASYCMENFNLGDQFRLVNGKEAYGQGIWAPCIRYHDGKFYVFSNINGLGMQVFISDSPNGPWTHKNMGGNIYDLSVLFDDDGRVYAVHKYGSVQLTELKPDLSGIVEGSTREIIPEGNAMGEGHHIYKIRGKYYIISADYSPMGRMQCARADRIEGPYETVTICQRESFGTPIGHLVHNVGLGRPVPGEGFKFNIGGQGGNRLGCATVHQGGIVDLPNGDWWGISMLDFTSVGRTVALSPVTWKNGWPYFGLDGNLGRVPRTWIKPSVGKDEVPHAPYMRSDDFNGKSLRDVWQWNHEPVAGKWKLAGGKLRLNTMPAKDYLWARNTLTQRGIGPVSAATVELEFSHLKDGDIAGIGLLNMPYAWLAVERNGNSFLLRMKDQNGDRVTDGVAVSPKSVLYLRVTGDFDNDIAHFSYSIDGRNYINIGAEVLMPYQLKTFQGTRYSLFAYNRKGKNGGYAEFDNFNIEEPLADRSGNLPLGKVVTFTNLGNGDRMLAMKHGIVHNAGLGSREYDSEAVRFLVHDRGNGRVVLEAMNGAGFVTVVGEGLSADVRLMKKETEGSLLMWQDMLRGQCMLMSMHTRRFIGCSPTTGEPYSADNAGATPDRKNGTVFQVEIIN